MARSGHADREDAQDAGRRDHGNLALHPGFVYNVVRQGTITVEDGCGEVHANSAGQAFETSEGRVHRAYNLGGEDAIESNMFVGPPGRPITVFIPGNERRWSTEHGRRM